MSDSLDGAAQTAGRPAASSAAPTPSVPFAVYLLGLSLFAMGSAEFLMGGILPMIARDLAISLPAAGTLISAFAIGALIGAPPLAILTLRWPRRAALLASQAAFATTTALSLLTDDYRSILLLRFFMGLAYACFWAVAASTAVQLAPAGRRAKALSIVVSGLTVAMVVGGPAGTFISAATGWRGGFWAVVAASTAAAVAVWLAMPRARAGQGPAPDVATEWRAMTRPVLWIAYATTATTTAAYMAVFGYLGALLLDVSRLPVSWLPAVLALFGVGAFVGLAIGGRTADRRPFATLVAGIAGLILVSVAIALMAQDRAAMVILVFLLGVAGFLLNPAVWGRVYLCAPDAPTLAGATNSSAFQLGLTLAPLAAGVPLAAGQGLGSVGWVGAITAVLALALALADAGLSRR